MIPPHELKNKEFTRVMRGYSIPEVDEYIAFLLEKYTELYRENDALERKLQSALDKVEEMKSEEQSIRTALINAQRTGRQIVADAQDRADKVMRSTKSDCLRILEEFRDKATVERNNLLELKTSVATLKKEMYEKYLKHIEMLEQISPNSEKEAESMRQTDSGQYAEMLSEGVRQIIREEQGIDLTDSEAGSEPIHPEEGNTVVFGTIFDQPGAPDDPLIGDGTPSDQ